MAQKACGGEFRYKVILLGNHGVGKTSIFRRIKDDTFFDQKTETTLGGIDIHQMTRKVGNDTIVIDLWDTGGAERFRTITDGYYRQTSAAILVFSVEDQVSCFDLIEWMENALHYIDTDFDDVTWIVWGNKCDMSFAEVGIKEAKSSLSAKFKVDRIKFSIVSAKTGKNVESQFAELAELIHSKAKTDGNKEPKDAVRFDQPPSNKERKCC
jgi:small GTP-binding protein